MAISFVGSHAGFHNSLTAQTVNFSNLLDESGGTPTLLEDDIVIVTIENSTTDVQRSQVDLTPSGYTAMHEPDYRNDANDSNFLVSYKIMSSTPDTSVDIIPTLNVQAGIAYVIHVFRGVDTTNVTSATTVVTGNKNSGYADAGAITPTVAGSWIMACGGAAINTGSNFENPTGMSTTTNHFRESYTGGGLDNDALCAVALYTEWTTGAYDPPVFGGSTGVGTSSWSSVTIALRPATISTIFPFVQVVIIS